MVFTNLDNRAKFEAIVNLPQMVLVTKSKASMPTQMLIFNDIKAFSTEFEAVILDADAPFLQMFTSGTVGRSKGVSVPLAALSTFYLYMRYAIDLKDTDNYWNIGEIAAGLGLYYAITGPLLMGITTHFNEMGFDAPKYLYDFWYAIKPRSASSPTAFRMMKSSGVFENVADKFMAA